MRLWTTHKEYAKFSWNRGNNCRKMQVKFVASLTWKCSKTGFGRFDSQNGEEYQQTPTSKTLNGISNAKIGQPVRPDCVTKKPKRQRKNLTAANWVFAEAIHVVGLTYRSRIIVCIFCAVVSPEFDFVLLVLAKRLTAKSVSKMTFFVSSGTFNINSLNQS